MDNPFKSPVILSLCPGILGLERGLERVVGTVSVTTYVEIEAFCIANLVAAMEKGVLAPAPIWTNLKTFDAHHFRGKIHGIIGGYPCQPFSLAGERKGENDPRHLWPYIRRTIKATRPVWCFFENVSGHLSMGFEQVYKELVAMGYAVEAGIYTAEEVGAPHERERLFILAVANTYRYERGLSKRKQRQKRSKQIDRIEFKRSGKEMANAFSHGDNGCTQQGNRRGERDLPDNQGNRHNVWGKAARCYRILGYTKSSEQQPLNRSISQEYTGVRNDGKLPHTECINGSITQVAGRQPKQQEPGEPCRSGQTNWPAPPGQEQHAWEPGRTTEPGVGSVFNGYNFREDFLRALGNSVVEQTAELAFSDLLEKHFQL